MGNSMADYMKQKEQDFFKRLRRMINKEKEEELIEKIQALSIAINKVDKRRIRKILKQIKRELEIELNSLK